MTHPPLLLAMGLILWGWQNDQLILSCFMALILEYSRWSKWQWNINDKDFNRIADLTSAFFFIFVIYQFSSESVHGIFHILSALPLIFFPLLLCQLYSKENTIQLSAIFLSLRHHNKELEYDYINRIDLAYPYLLVCILSASIGNQRTIIFYIGICIIIIYALFKNRPRRYHLSIWSAMLISACLLGFAGQNGLQLLQDQFELMAGDFIEQMLWRNRFPDKTHTAIGSIGKLKLSDQIHVRVKSKKPLHERLLLREAAYTKYGYGLWTNENNDFTLIDPEISGREWNLGPEPGNHSSLTVSAKLVNEEGVIPVPNGTFRISNVAALAINRYNQGAIHLEMKPGWIEYDTHFGTELLLNNNPIQDDLHIHHSYKPVIEQVANEIGLYSKSETEIVSAIEHYFKEYFNYSLIQSYKFKGKNRLEDFLLYRKQGHCEYFATATTLLLRAAGIPARYTVGYSVQEFSRLENQYIARARDAHSWVTAYINGRWQILDTTPATWALIEAEGEPWWLPVSDFWSWLHYQVSSWKNRDPEKENTKSLLGIVIILLIYLGWRLKFKKQQKPKQLKFEKPFDKKHYPGMDSPFYIFFQCLEKKMPKQYPGETMKTWLHRINHQMDDILSNEVLNLHYRYRFDPAGLDNQEKKEFNLKIKSLIDLL